MSANDHRGGATWGPAPKEWLAGYFSPEPVEIEFLDSGGLRWTRDEGGVLTRDETRSAPSTSPGA